MSRRGSALGLLGLALLAPAGAGANLGAEMAAELRLRPLERSGDEKALRAVYANPGSPARARGRALYALYADKVPPLDTEDRLLLVTALGDPAPEVRLAAVRAVAHARDRALEGEALKRVAEDPDPEVCAEALRAVRPWSRQGHLFFLQQALYNSSPHVQAEALRNLALVPFREIPPQMLAAVETTATQSVWPEPRLRALEALRSWRRLDWPVLRDILMGGESSEALRLLAVEASDSLAPPAERQAALLTLFATDPSQRLAWEAFRRLRRGSADEGAFLTQVARYLSYSGRRNTATEEMAKLLRSRGYRVDYRSGAWKVLSAR